MRPIYSGAGPVSVEWTRHQFGRNIVRVDRIVLLWGRPYETVEEGQPLPVRLSCTAYRHEPADEGPVAGLHADEVEFGESFRLGPSVS